MAHRASGKHHRTGILLPQSVKMFPANKTAERSDGVEAFRALLKRGYHGAFHHVSAKRPNRCISELAPRLNIHNSDVPHQVTGVSRNVESMRLRGKAMIA